MGIQRLGTLGTQVGSGAASESTYGVRTFRRSLCVDREGWAMLVRERQGANNLAARLVAKISPACLWKCARVLHLQQLGPQHEVALGRVWAASRTWRLPGHRGVARPRPRPLPP